MNSKAPGVVWISSKMELHALSREGRVFPRYWNL